MNSLFDFIDVFAKQLSSKRTAPKKCKTKRRKTTKPDKYLLALMNKINDEYFQFEELPHIKWSKGQIKKHYRKLMLGAYDLHKNEIRLHPLFREEKLPETILEFVIYHELLHYEDRHHLIKRKRGHRVHNKTFHQREKAHPYYKEATRTVKQLMQTGF